jgi:predicted esterase
MKYKYFHKHIFLLIGIGGLLLSIQLLAEQNEPALTKQEQLAFKNIISEWNKLCEWCIPKKLGTEARQLADRIESIDPLYSGFKSLKERATSCEDSAIDDDKKAYETKLSSAKRTVAGYYDGLINSLLQSTDQKAKERCDAYSLTALELAPTDSRWNVVSSATNNLIKDKKFDRAVNMIDRAQSLNPPEKFAQGFKTALDNVALVNLILKTAFAHPIKYYFSLPTEFKRTKDKKWPVLICVDGAGSDFKGRAASYKNKRGNLPYIVVGPCTFSNTNAIEGNMLKKYQQYYSDDIIEEAKKQKFEWDEQGILAIINELQVNYNAESKVYITGFSGGGNAAYLMIFKHPNLLNGAAPACANFISRGYADIKGQFSGDDLNFPIHILTGEKDPHREYAFGKKEMPGIEPQTDRAEAQLKEFEYPNCKRTMVPGMGHSAAEDQVIATFKSYWEGKKKRADKLD